MLHFLLLLTGSLGFTCVISVTIPPKITMQSPADIFYKKGETVKMVCEASGDPKPSYTWTRAGVAFAPEGNDDRIVQQKGAGTLIINSPEDKDENIYQCFASNSYGTAATIKFNLKMAKLEEFKTSSPTTYTPQLGTSLTLSCQSPNSVPDAQIYWTVGRYDDQRPLFWDSRVTMDYEDRLYFTYVTSADSQDGQPYQCVAYNSLMRMSVVGPPHYIQPTGTNPIMQPMTKLWPASRFDQKALVGTDVKMKCIFSGNPTPNVRWRRKDSQPFSDRVELGYSGGQELVVRDVRPEDAGTYLCDGTREQESTPLEMSFNLNVNALPTWIRQPKDVFAGPGENVQFHCSAAGVPPPQIFWFVNGKPLETALRADPRLDSRFRRLREDTIFLGPVSQQDALVFQCNATNIHGYVWGEALLNVLEEPPTILEHPRDSKVAEGQPFTMVCYVAGKPDPIITWFRDEQQITGGRYLVGETGNLFVQAAVLSDAGDYKCVAHNIKGRQETVASVIVRRKTVIQWRPMDLEIQRGSIAKFTCSGTTDPEEVEKMATIWLKDGAVIDLGTRVFLNMQDNSLTISGSEQRDTGTYTCVITNGLDNDTSSARLVVIDIPDAPYDVKVKSDRECQSEGRAEAEVTWTTGSFNNAPIQYFIIEYMTKVETNRWVFGVRVGYRNISATIPLAAGMDYSFRVTAYNKIGASPPSVPSNTSCVTAPGPPTQNPRNLRTVGDRPGKVHVEWTPVPPEHHGGSNFYYVINILRQGDPDNARFQDRIADWRTSEYLYTSSSDTFTRYRVIIRSVNSVGDCTESPREILGHSSELGPMVWPSDLSVSNIEPDQADFTWQFDSSQIGKPDTQIRGEFMGFKVQIWEQGQQAETLREYNVPPEAALASASFNTFSARVPYLTPNSHLQARVSVLNNFFVSRPSDIVSFVTPSGLPGAVWMLEDLNIGDNHVNLQWRPPLENRGDIIGYDIGYQEVYGLRLEEMQERLPQVDDPHATTAVLGGLRPATKYRIHIWARTSLGRGDGFFIERTTTSPGDPALPRFTISKVGPDFINLTWWRDAYGTSGSVVYAQYQKEDGPEWFSTYPDVSRDWLAIRFLEPGIRYSVRLVVTNGEIRRLSEMEDVTTEGTAKAYDIEANLGWFLGMLFSTLLEIVLFVVFLVCYRKGYRLKDLQPEVRTYRSGADTFTGIHSNREKIQRVSAEFGPEPRGHTNEIYKEEYFTDDVSDTPAYQKKAQAAEQRYYDDFDDDNAEYQNNDNEYEHRYQGNDYDEFSQTDNHNDQVHRYSRYEGENNHSGSQHLEYEEYGVEERSDYGTKDRSEQVEAETNPIAPSRKSKSRDQVLEGRTERSEPREQKQVTRATVTRDHPRQRDQTDSHGQESRDERGHQMSRAPRTDSSQRFPEDHDSRSAQTDSHGQEAKDGRGYQMSKAPRTDSSQRFPEDHDSRSAQTDSHGQESRDGRGHQMSRAPRTDSSQRFPEDHDSRSAQTAEGAQTSWRDSEQWKPRVPAHSSRKLQEAVKDPRQVQGHQSQEMTYNPEGAGRAARQTSVKFDDVLQEFKRTKQPGKVQSGSDDGQERYTSTLI